ncbi:hypothetical protein BPC006_II2559 [Burkholderia pseudomallei BPC006]|nr:hypothetical protein BPC006_II2559 [Burkholderia pseudomallei BPC006]
MRCGARLVFAARETGSGAWGVIAGCLCARHGRAV